jgi:hypothetical protein
LGRSRQRQDGGHDGTRHERRPETMNRAHFLNPSRT